MKIIKVTFELELLVPDETKNVTIDKDGDIYCWEGETKPCIQELQWLQQGRYEGLMEKPTVLNWSDINIEVEDNDSRD